MLNDLDLQDVLVLNLSRAVQICVDIAVHILSERKQPPPERMGKAFELLAQEGVLESELAQRLKKSVAFATWRDTTMRPSTGLSSTPLPLVTWWTLRPSPKL